jgi:hypothetical protein
MERQSGIAEAMDEVHGQRGQFRLASLIEEHQEDLGRGDGGVEERDTARTAGADARERT